eukprot:2019326-Amphidinium_carterae.1
MSCSWLRLLLPIASTACTGAARIGTGGAAGLKPTAAILLFREKVCYKPACPRSWPDKSTNQFQKVRVSEKYLVRRHVSPSTTHRFPAHDTYIRWIGSIADHQGKCDEVLQSSYTEFMHVLDELLLGGNATIRFLETGHSTVHAEIATRA